MKSISFRFKLKSIWAFGMIALCIAFADMTVSAAPYASTSSQGNLSIDPYLTLSKGDTYQLSPIITGTGIQSSNLTYTSSNPKYIEVNSLGLVTALRRGNARITITDQASSQSCQIRIYVGKRASRLKLNTYKKTIYVDNYYMLKATLSPYRTAMKKLQYTSSKPSVARVSSKGKITALTPGTTTITVSTLDGSNLTKTCLITVLKEEKQSTEDTSTKYDFFIFDNGTGNSASTPAKQLQKPIS